jgi:hypothetical protein
MPHGNRVNRRPKSAPTTINHLNPNPRRNAMLEALVRFIEELIDVFNFGSNISK